MKATALSLLFGFTWLLSAVPVAADSPRLALIIDDLGDRIDLDIGMADLPVPLSCAILPHTPHARRLAGHCRDNGHEVMLHIPLQAVARNELLGPGRLKMDMDEPTFRATFRASLASVPGALGVNNHMGSLLTRHPGAMAWLMEELQEAGLFFVDSRTTADSVALDIAREHSVPAGARDVFLDAVRDVEMIEAELDRAIRIAHITGQAVVIGHPYPETLEVLQRRLPWLETETGVRLIPMRELLGIGEDGDVSAAIRLSEGEDDEQTGTRSAGGGL
ncbi:divergent polysaccharide deacetylase family protein [Natronospira bacteriovora]|uniref:Divergent polysaccharide deacetylase family protein n=1 Tax=Natronospira bacteriovora TaxID=3069753 RepID=A0ABU0W753_9GAMM|nr:divergent polysaccharide deacetylase family protein [Natronospira sp. AB-CW4]MDQ2069862.1 divergent polysaccharide deacetylase family protein [Natronospira sp. AB-CW4]